MYNGEQWAIAGMHHRSRVGREGGWENAFTLLMGACSLLRLI